MDADTDVSTVLSTLWTQLVRASEDSAHPFRRLTFATIRAKTPRLRSVILRRVEKAERRLSFHTDRRSEKVSELRSNNRIAWHGWDPDRRVQIRLRGEATTHIDDSICDEMWTAQPPRSLATYIQQSAPGVKIEAPADGVGGARRASLGRDDVAAGRPNFAVVRTVIDEIDWLRLEPKGHVRAQFQFDRRRRVFQGTWVAP